MRLCIRHVGGSRATELYIVELGAHRELIFGRAASAAVRFDALRDGIVGRHHARVVWDPDRPTMLQLVDLQSRNGTWVNGRRVNAVELRSGDMVRLGVDGPMFEVLIEIQSALLRVTEHSQDHPIRPLS